MFVHRIIMLSAGKFVFVDGSELYHTTNIHDAFRVSNLQDLIVLVERSVCFGKELKDNIVQTNFISPFFSEPQMAS